MIEVSKALTVLRYDGTSTIEEPEKCSLCKKSVDIGSQIMRDNKIKNIVCRSCIAEILKLV